MMITLQMSADDLVFAVACAAASLAYADQAERDHAALKVAVRKGKIAV